MTSVGPLQLSIAKEFSRTPGPRFKNEGKYSGEAFLEVLRERFKKARELNTRLLVDLDGAAGYATSFLEAAFGGLAREEDQQVVLETLAFKSEDEPDLVEEIKQYIREARL
jgi:hypothetical protein